MCEELKLVETHLGIWKLEDWDINACSSQLNGKFGIYCIKNLINNKLLIGEGYYESRLWSHTNAHSSNTIWKKDFKEYGQENFRLIWIIPEEDEINRKLIENKLQIHFGENCYNKPRREYPTQEELLTYESQHSSHDSILDKLNNYTKIERNYIDKCWESNYSVRNTGYSSVYFDTKEYQHHVLMYIFHFGDICGVSSIMHHKCENKRCVNPEHLEPITHKENIQLHYNTKDNKKQAIRLYSNGFSIKEIADSLNMSRCTISRYIDFKTSSNYRGIGYDKTRKSHRAWIKINEKYFNLGHYSNEIYAAQNRDYYIVKNNLWHQRNTTLNFHDIDYNNFIPHKMLSERINKHLI